MGQLPKVTKRRDLIKRFKELGWSGPHKGVGDHPEYMTKGTRAVKIPNPHSKGRGSEVNEWLLKAILRQAGITSDEWLDK